MSTTTTYKKAEINTFPDLVKLLPPQETVEDALQDLFNLRSGEQLYEQAEKDSAEGKIDKTVSFEFYPNQTTASFLRVVLGYKGKEGKVIKAEIGKQLAHYLNMIVFKTPAIVKAGNLVRKLYVTQAKKDALKMLKAMRAGCVDLRCMNENFSDVFTEMEDMRKGVPAYMSVWGSVFKHAARVLSLPVEEVEEAPATPEVVVEGSPSQ